MEPKSDVHYLDNLEATELRLGLPGSNAPNSSPNKGNKRALEVTSTTGSSNTEECTSLDPTPPAKALVVGWPPVQSFRRNSFNARRGKEEEDAIKVKGGCGNRVGTGVLKVKVGMDGAPYLRKIDLMMYKGYKELSLALADMFKGFSIGENTITYEDKDGDWMLVGDVPWEMFTSSCNKLRIMRNT